MSTIPDRSTGKAAMAAGAEERDMAVIKTRTQAVLSYRKGDTSEPVVEHAIGDALRLAAQNWGGQMALVDGSPTASPPRRWTFEQLLEDAEQVARALLGRFAPGDHVAMWSPNCPEWVLLELGAALAGITLVTVNPAYLAKELVHVLKQSKAHGIFFCPEYRGRDFRGVLRQIAADVPSLREVICLSDWSDFLKSGRTNRRLPEVRPDDVAQIQYTSGTTGFPKGAELTHRGLVNNSRFFARVIGANTGDVWINPMPMFHTAGCGLATLGALQTGGLHVLPPGFDPALALDLFEHHHGTLMLNVPTMLVRMLDQPGLQKRNLSSWRLTALGGAPVPPELVRRARAEFGVEVAIGFGQTESSPYITHTLPQDPNHHWCETVGRPLPHTEVKIVSPATGETVPVGVVGEVCARSICVMKGYFDDSKSTAEALDTEGWLHTGDLGSMDADGYCRIQGRLKDMIIRGGENIYPREIEDVLYTHPGIATVAVVGVPDPEWGEIVVAFVQLRPGQDLSGDELSVFCRDRLASYKAPRIWRFVAQFPQTASGKIQKFVLRDDFLASMKQPDGTLNRKAAQQPGLPNLEGAEAPVSTLCEMFDRAVATAPDAVALRHRGVALTYREMGRAVSALAQRLTEIVEPGDVVALVLPNSIEFQIGYFASLKALAAPALFNPMYPPEQLVPLLREVVPRAVICAPAARQMMVRLTDDLGIPSLICLGQHTPGLVRVGQDITVAELIDHAEVPLRIRAATPTDSGALLFSGGTTGLPKAVEHTHGRLIQAVRGMEHIFPLSSDHEVFLAIAPFTHIYGFLLGVLVPISARGETVIAERFQPEHIVELLERHHVTFFGGGPPAIYAGILAASNLGSADLSALKVCPGGGAPFPIELMDRWRRATRLPIREGYGMSEVAPISGLTDQSGIRPGSVGKPVPGCEVQVVDLDTGLQVLPRGERGELRVRGPHMMAGYRGRPEETAQTIRNGFIYTGDIGYLDEDGCVFITDRKKDVVFVRASMSSHARSKT